MILILSSDGAATWWLFSISQKKRSQRYTILTLKLNQTQFKISIRAHKKNQLTLSIPTWFPLAIFCPFFIKIHLTRQYFAIFCNSFYPNSPHWPLLSKFPSLATICLPPAFSSLLSMTNPPWSRSSMWSWNFDYFCQKSDFLFCPWSRSVCSQCCPGQEDSCLSPPLRNTSGNNLEIFQFLGIKNIFSQSDCFSTRQQVIWCPPTFWDMSPVSKII